MNQGESKSSSSEGESVEDKDMGLTAEDEKNNESTSRNTSGESEDAEIQDIVANLWGTFTYFDEDGCRCPKKEMEDSDWAEFRRIFNEAMQKGKAAEQVAKVKVPVKGAELALNLLFCLMAMKAPVDVVQAVLEANPDASMEKLYAGATPLHVGMVQNAALESIQAVLEVLPGAAKEKDDDGRTPLHCGIREGAPFESIKAVLEVFPDAAKEKDVFGQTPLHGGMRECVPFESTKAILEVFPGAAKEKDDLRQTPLHCGIRAGAPFESIKAVLEAFPDAAKEKDRNGMTPLHLGLKEGAPFESVQTVLEVFPGAAKEKDRHGQTPLHIGMGEGAPFESVQAVLEVFPGAVKEKNHDGLTPLHLGMKKGATLGSIHAILKAFPGAAREKDNTGKSPLHLGMQEGAPFESVQTVLEVFPGAAKEKDRYGRTPLHIGMREGAPFESVQAVLNVAPIAAMEKDNICWTPLHSGMESGAPFESIQAVLEVFSGAAKEKDEKGQTPLHLGMREGTPVESVQAVLEVFPDAAKEKNNDGKTPLRVGMERCAPFKSIQAVLNVFPDAAKEQDAKILTVESLTPLHIGLNEGAPVDSILAVLKVFPGAAKVADSNGRIPLLTGIQYGKKPHVIEAVFNCYEHAAYQEDTNGSSPMNALLNMLLHRKERYERSWVLYMLHAFCKVLRDGRQLSRLCNRSNREGLQFFFDILSPDSSVNSEKGKSIPPTLNLNDTPIPEWFMLEILADLETEEASEIFFQIEDQLRNYHQDGNSLTIVIKDKEAKEVARFVSTEKVEETTWREVADRAKASNIPKLREWGEKYGRFLGKYLLNEELKHKSETCIVLFGSELVDKEYWKNQDGNEKVYTKREERKVALKFMADDEAVKREIEKRKKIGRISTTAKVYVIMIKAAYTSKKELSDSDMTFEKDLSKEIERLQYVSLNPKEGETEGVKICHVLVMDCGSGQDLSDVLSHQDVARKNIDMALHAAKSIAKCLKFLNEECSVMHGDVKPRNFVPLGVAGRYMAIDMDNAGEIAKEDAGLKRTSSGYLPPEQAAVVYFDRVEGTRKADGTGIEAAKAKVDEIESQIENHEKAFGTMAVSNWVTKHDQLRERLFHAKRDLKELQTALRPDSVKASSQYDMWCFGVLLFRLCTNQDLFYCDGYENAKNDDELKKIKDWNEKELLLRMNAVPDKGGWQNIIPILKDLLQSDPSKRPHKWSSIIDRLEGNLSENEIRQELKGIREAQNNIHGEVVNFRAENREMLESLRDQLAKLEESVNNIPDFIAEMENVCCPYLFRIITEEQFVEFKDSKSEDPSKLDTVEGALGRAQECFEGLKGFLEDLESGDLKKQAKEHILKMSWQRISKHEKKVSYLQLLCGWTFKPVVSYKVETDKYSEDFVKLAQVGAKMCAVGIKVAVLWNTASGVARMFGYPIINLPQDPINQAKAFLESIDNFDPLTGLNERKEAGFSIQELNEFKSFLDKLEDGGKMRHMGEEFDKGALKSGKWTEAFSREPTKDAKKRVTWISSEASKKFKQYGESDIKLM